MAFSLLEVVAELPPIDVVDVGASSVDGPRRYQPLIDAGKARVVGFEPALEEYRALQEQAKPFETYFPYAIGDGDEATLRICNWAGMNSLLEPDMEILNHFHAFGEWARVIRREKVTTHRLDDVDAVKSIDYLKLDAQGSELAIMRGGGRKLRQTLVVHTEVQFVPFYKGQPLFADLDRELLQAGFYLHRFATLISRLFKPLLANNDMNAGFSQLLWTDAVYVRKFTDFGHLTTESLLKIAFILHEIYGSFDFVGLALEHVDRREATNWQAAYFGRVVEQR